MTTITEADVEQAALSWLEDLGWQVAHGRDIAPDTPGAERNDYGQVVLERQLRDAQLYYPKPQEATMMNRNDELRQRILSGRADANIRFGELRLFLLRLGFVERVGGSPIFSGKKASANG